MVYLLALPTFTQGLRTIRMALNDGFVADALFAAAAAAACCCGGATVRVEAHDCARTTLRRGRRLGSTSSEPRALSGRYQLTHRV